MIGTILKYSVLDMLSNLLHPMLQLRYEKYTLSELKQSQFDTTL